MPVYSFGGYDGADFIVVGGGAPGIGSHVRLASDWSASSHAIGFEISDTDATFDRSATGQTGTVTDASGAPITAGSTSLSGWGAGLDDGNGGTVSIYEVHVDGALVGYVSDGEVQPGVDYQITTVLSLGTPGLAYGDIFTSGYEQADANTVEGGNHDDVISGGDGGDTLSGHAGDDIIEGGAGADLIHGLDGDDRLSGGTGDDWVHAERGSDTVLVAEGDGNDIISLGEDEDDGDRDSLVFSGAGGVTVTFTGWEQGTYTMAGASGQFWEVELIEGSEGGDVIDAAGIAGAPITVQGHGGDDTITGGSGDDTLEGGAGLDTIRGGDGADTIRGEGGDDEIYGEAGDDVIDAGTGHDEIQAGAGSDTISTGDGHDIIFIRPGDGADTVTDFDMTDAGGMTIDQLDVSALGVSGYEVVVGDDGAGNAVLTFPGGESLTLLGVAPAAVTVPQMAAMGIPCFTAGAMIATPEGPRAVERLRAGDRVLTGRGPERLLWTGARKLDRAALEARPKLKPVEVCGRKVSPQHCFLARAEGREWLVRARHLALEGCPGARIARGCRQVSYHHLLLPRHGLLMADGLWQESFYPGPYALSTLAPGALLSLLAAFPALAGVLGGVAHVEAAYGPTVRPILPRARLRALPRAARRELLVRSEEALAAVV